MWKCCTIRLRSRYAGGIPFSTSQFLFGRFFSTRSCLYKTKVHRLTSTRVTPETTYVHTCGHQLNLETESIFSSTSLQTSGWCHSCPIFCLIAKYWAAVNLCINCTVWRIFVLGIKSFRHQDTSVPKCLTPRHTLTRGVDPGVAGGPGTQYFAKGAVHQSSPSNN